MNSAPDGSSTERTGDVLVEHAGRIAVVTLARTPDNALASSTYQEIGDTFRELGRNDGISVVLVRSNQRVFCAGADINELGKLTGQDAIIADGARQVLARETFDQIMSVPQPTIAVLDGPAIGAGAVIASCCDIRVASRAASFQLPEVAVGRCGGARHMMRHLPQGVVRRMYFTADRLSAEDAEKYGLIELVNDDSAFGAAMDLARKIAAHSPLALRLGKEALNFSEPLGVRDGYALEQEYTLKLARSNDAREALAARREKRAPVYTGT